MEVILGKHYCNGEITFFKEDGTIVARFPLKGGTDHNERCKIAENNNIKDWHHYSMHQIMVGDKNYYLLGMKKVLDKNYHFFYRINPVTGKLSKRDTSLKEWAKIVKRTNEIKKELNGKKS